MPEGRPVILVMERGFVLFARIRPHPEDFLFLLGNDVATVRRWGTTAGLGELASKGPLPQTVLDPEGDSIELRKTAIYRIIPCSEEAWRGYPGKRK